MFPTDKHFATNEITKYRDLHIGIYAIEKASPIETKFGDGLKLDLADKNQNKFTVWGPTKLVRDYDPEIHNFLRNNGLKSKKNNKYFDFDLIHFEVNLFTVNGISSS